MSERAANIRTAGHPTLIHEALLYRNDGHLGDVVLDFASQAAGAGEPLLVVLPPASEGVVRSAVRDSGAELHFEDMSACGRNPTCLLDLFEDWIEAHDGPVRVIDEPAWPGRRRAEVVEVLRHEALLNHVLGAGYRRRRRPGVVADQPALRSGRVAHR